MTYRDETLVTVTVYCDGPCGNRTAHQYSAPRRVEAYQQACKAGWMINQLTGKVLCSECRPKRRSALKSTENDARSRKTLGV